MAFHPGPPGGVAPQALSVFLRHVLVVGAGVEARMGLLHLEVEAGPGPGLPVDVDLVRGFWNVFRLVEEVDLVGGPVDHRSEVRGGCTCQVGTLAGASHECDHAGVSCAAPRALALIGISASAA